MDEDVAVAPTQVGGHAHPSAEVYAALKAAVAAFGPSRVPTLASGDKATSTVSFGELVAAGALTVLESPPTLIPRDLAAVMLTAKDIRLDRRPSQSADPNTPGAVTVRIGDVVVVNGGASAVAVCAHEALLAPGVVALRVDPALIDAEFLAGTVRAAQDAAEGKPIDLMSVGIARLRLEDQRRAGAAMAQLVQVDKAWRAHRADIERLVRHGVLELATGALRAVDDPDGTARGQ